jgi:hypothetical protein
LCFCFIFLRVVYPVLSVSLDSPFVIALSVFSNVHSLIMLVISVRVDLRLVCHYNSI